MTWNIRLFIFCVICNFSKCDPAGIYLLKANNRNTRARCEICSKLTIKTPERRHLLLKAWLPPMRLTYSHVYF